jgi:hypothetical protein
VSWSGGHARRSRSRSDAARQHGHGEPGVDRRSAAARGPSAARERYVKIEVRQAADKPPRSAAQDAGLVNCRFPPAADPLAGASLQCAGAIRLGPVAAVRFAGPDRYWDGCHDFGRLSAREARRTQLARIGPRRDELGTFATLISRFVHLPVSADNPVSLCDQGIFMDQAAKPVPAQNAHTGHFDRRMRASGGRLLLH